MPDVHRDTYSKALIFTPTEEEKSLLRLKKENQLLSESLKEKEHYVDSLIAKLESKI